MSHHRNYTSFQWFYCCLAISQTNQSNYACIEFIHIYILTTVTLLWDIVCTDITSSRCESTYPVSLLLLNQRQWCYCSIKDNGAWLANFLMSILYMIIYGISKHAMAARCNLHVSMQSDPMYWFFATSFRYSIKY